MAKKKTDTTTNTDSDDMVISYRVLRRVVGIIGIALPIVLFVVESLLKGRVHLLDSISSYYWAERTGDVLVGSLCAMGMFFLSYRGRRYDNLAGNLACAFAVGVALFPTSEPGKPRNLTNYIHYASAAGMFLTLAYFCFFSFTYQDPNTKPTKMKPVRNKIYIGCGAVILLCIAAIGLIGIAWPGDASSSAVFWLEAAAIWAFGWSWFIKGKGLGLVQG